MNTTDNRRRLGLFAGLLLAVLLACQAAYAARRIVTTGNLAFGRFAAGSGGSISVAPGGMRTRSGGVILLSSSPSAASFALDPPGKDDKLLIITLPPDGSVTIGSGSASMAMNNFVSNAPVDGQLNPPNNVLLVGATVQVAPNQGAGNYTGSFPVIVELQ